MHYIEIWRLFCQLNVLRFTEYYFWLIFLNIKERKFVKNKSQSGAN